MRNATLPVRDEDDEVLVSLPRLARILRVDQEVLLALPGFGEQCHVRAEHRGDEVRLTIYVDLARALGVGDERSAAALDPRENRRVEEVLTKIFYG